MNELLLTANEYIQLGRIFSHVLEVAEAEFQIKPLADGSIVGKLGESVLVLHPEQFDLMVKVLSNRGQA